MSTICLTNWSSRALHGPGRKWTIMARPQAWERGDGRVSLLVPALSAVLGVRYGAVSMEEYREQYVRGVEDIGSRIGPGVLTAHIGSSAVVVEGGDTLCCACSRMAALAGACHRVWAGELLRRAGWHVVLDGQGLAGVTETWQPEFVMPF